MNIDFTNVSWADVVAFFQNPALYIYFSITVLGIIVHFGKAVYIEGKADRSLIKYWTDNTRASTIAVASALCGFAYLYNTNTQDVFGYFGMGYVANSFFNRAGISLEEKTSYPLTASSGAKSKWRTFLGW